MEVLPAVRPVVGDLGRGDRDQAVAGDRLEIRQRRQLAGGAVDRVLDVAVAPLLLDPSRGQLDQVGEHPLGELRTAANGEPDHLPRLARARRRERQPPSPRASSRAPGTRRAARPARAAPCSGRRARRRPAPRADRRAPRREAMAAPGPARRSARRAGPPPGPRSRARRRGSARSRRAAEHRSSRGQLDHGDQILAVALEALVVRDHHLDVEIPGPSRRSRRRARPRRSGSAARTRSPGGPRPPRCAPGRSVPRLRTPHMASRAPAPGRRRSGTRRSARPDRRRPARPRGARRCRRTSRRPGSAFRARRRCPRQRSQVETASNDTSREAPVSTSSRLTSTCAATSPPLAGPGRPNPNSSLNSGSPRPKNADSTSSKLPKASLCGAQPPERRPSWPKAS